jgi:hypothetical protein
MEKAAECLSCPAGKISVSNSSISNGQAGPQMCTVCLEGMYSPVDASAACWECPFNTYSDVSGASACINCPAGKYTGENDRMTYCLDDPTGMPTSQPTSPTTVPTKMPAVPPTESLKNGLNEVTSNDAIIGALVAVGLILCLACLACYYCYYFRRKRLDGSDSGISPYEKWMAIEEAKKSGKDPNAPNINFAKTDQKAAAINLQKREVHKLHHHMGTEGYEEKKKRGSVMGGMTRRMSAMDSQGTIAHNNAAVAGDGVGNRLSTIRASEADMDDLYGRPSRTSKFAGMADFDADGLAEVVPDRGSAQETTNPMFGGGGGEFSGQNPLAQQNPLANQGAENSI